MSELARKSPGNHVGWAFPTKDTPRPATLFCLPTHGLARALSFPLSGLARLGLLRKTPPVGCSLAIANRHLLRQYYIPVSNN